MVKSVNRVTKYAICSLPSPPHTPVLFKGWYKRIIQGYLVTIDIERSHCM